MVRKQSSSSKTKYYISILIFLVLSIIWIIKVKTKPFSDFSYYNTLAKEIANGGAWGDTYTSVGYPIFLALFYKLFGSNILVAKIINLILTLSSIILFKNILDLTNLSEKNKFIIFLLYVFFPSTIFYNSILGSEILFTFLVLLITYLYFNKNVKFKYLFIGILTGITTMVKPFFIIYFFAIFLFELIFKNGFFKSLKHSLTILLIALITLSPWIYRNTKLNHEFTFVSNNGGIVIYINNNSQNNIGRWMPISKVKNSIAETNEYKNSSMTHKNKMLKAAAKDWIKKHPKKFISLGFKRLANTYFLGDDIYYSLHGANLTASIDYIFLYETIKFIILLISILYIIFYTIYVVICIIKKQTKLLNKFNIYFCLLFYMFTCVYFVTEGQARYAFPIIFIFCFEFWKCIMYIFNKFKTKTKTIMIKSLK